MTGQRVYPCVRVLCCVLGFICYAFIPPSIYLGTVWFIHNDCAHHINIECVAYLIYAVISGVVDLAIMSYSSVILFMLIREKINDCLQILQEDLFYVERNNIDPPNDAVYGG